jgi:opacity protein-like surface antigen
MRSLLAIALIAAAASTASAEGYLGLGIGTAASPSGDLPMTSNDGARTGRLLGGYRFGRFSIEGTASRYSIYKANASYDGTVLAAAGKYSLPLGDNFEAFGRLGLARTWLNTDTNNADWAGNGLLLGAGFEYRFLIAKTGVSAFVDYQRIQSNLDRQSDSQMTKGMGIGLWTLGFSVSL